MRRFLILIALLSITALALAQTGRAQNEVQLESLEVNLWPEYDRPDMLVIYKIKLLPESSPADLTFRIPKAVSSPIQVAVLEDSNLFQTPYTQQTGSEWIEVTFHATTTDYQIEYYDPRLVKQGPSRTFEYTWPGDYAVISANIIVQEPQDATQIQFTPATVTSFKDVNGQVYYADQIGTLSKGQTYNFSLGYQKSTNVLTLDVQRVREVSALPQTMWIRGLPWALGVLALVLIAGGVWIYWRSGLPQSSEKRRKRRKPAPQASGDTAADESGVYCHSCGRRATGGDVFCRSCGTKLRI